MISVNDSKAVNSPVLTMTSREIAELTGKRHPDVKRDIEVMLEQLAASVLKTDGTYRANQHGDVSKFAHTYFDSMNRPQIEYVLDREHTECLITGYSAELRMKVIRRVRELEEAMRIGETRQAQQSSLDIRAVPPAFLRQMADLLEENEKLRNGTPQSKPGRPRRVRPAIEVDTTATANSGRRPLHAFWDVPAIKDYSAEFAAIEKILNEHGNYWMAKGGLVDKLRHRAPFKVKGKPARADKMKNVLKEMNAQGLLEERGHCVRMLHKS